MQYEDASAQSADFAPATRSGYISADDRRRILARKHLQVSPSKGIVMDDTFQGEIFEGEELLFDPTVPSCTRGASEHELLLSRAT